MFCAKTCTREPRVESTIAVSAVNAGQLATSTPSDVETRGSRAWMKSSASATVLFIFQLPAISGVLLLTPASISRGPLSEDVYPWQSPALDQFKCSAAAGRDVRHLLREPELLDGRRRVTAADDRHPGRGRERFRHRPRACGERVELERAHRAIPEHGPRLRDP